MAPRDALHEIGEFKSPWPHRLAWMLAVTIFPLIWMGGTVTTYDAGMAVAAHAAVASLMLAASLSLALWLARSLRGTRR